MDGERGDCKLRISSTYLVDIVQNNEKTGTLQTGIFNDSAKIIHDRNRGRSPRVKSSKGIGKEWYVVVVRKQSLQHVRDHKDKVVNLTVLEVVGHHNDVGR